MNKCPKCGSYIPEGGKMCIACGWKPETTNDTNADFINANPYINYMQEIYDTVVNKFPKDGSGAEMELLPHDDNRWIAAASYIGPAFLYTYFVKGKDSEIIKYHANQACVLFGAEVLSAIFYRNKIPVIGGALKKATNLLLFVLAFVGARAAVANQKKPLPVLGDLNITILK